ncbi:MAG TPA: hypothetical protein DDX29_01245 [Clostridiales bacterium]|nr:hypothetical protein [Clostridiales bacterium]
MDDIMEKKVDERYWPGRKDLVGRSVTFGKSGDRYVVGSGGNLVRKYKPISKKKQRKLDRQKRIGG